MKETNFFSEEKQWEKGLAYYESLWNWNSDQFSVALEASPNYTNSLLEATTVAQRTYAVSQAEKAQFKFIYILRDPVKKIASMRKQGVYQGWYMPLLAKETLDTLPTEVIECVRYAEVADQFVAKFSPENVLLLQTNELSQKGNPKAVMNKVCSFLAIDADFVFSLDKIYNAQNSYRNDTLWHLLRSSPYLTPLKLLMPNTLKNRARSVLAKPPKTSTKVVPPLTKAQQTFILNALREDRAKLETTYGLDLSSWQHTATEA